MIGFARGGCASVVLTAGAFLACIGCGGGAKQSEPQAQTPPASQSAQAEPEKRFDLKGKVITVDKQQKVLTVDHEAIPGFMGAMTMPYPVKDEQLLQNLSPGDEVTANVVAGPAGIWLDKIVVVGKAPAGK